MFGCLSGKFGCILIGSGVYKIVHEAKKEVIKLRNRGQEDQEQS